MAGSYEVWRLAPEVLLLVDGREDETRRRRISLPGHSVRALDNFTIRSGWLLILWAPESAIEQSVGGAALMVALPPGDYEVLVGAALTSTSWPRADIVDRVGLQGPSPIVHGITAGGPHDHRSVASRPRSSSSRRGATRPEQRGILPLDHDPIPRPPARDQRRRPEQGADGGPARASRELGHTKVHVHRQRQRDPSSDCSAATIKRELEEALPTAFKLDSELIVGPRLDAANSAVVRQLPKGVGDLRPRQQRCVFPPSWAGSSPRPSTRWELAGVDSQIGDEVLGFVPSTPP